MRENRKEFFSYMLTLFRGQFGEHGGRLPAVDVTGMEHLAWTLDALYYMLQVRVRGLVDHSHTLTHS